MLVPSRRWTAVAAPLVLALGLYVGPSARAAAAKANEARVSNPPSLLDTLESLERKSWVAWKARDGKYFEGFLSSDHLEVGFGGQTDKATVVKGVASPVCVVASYHVEGFKVTSFDAHTAALTYHAAQDTKCGANAVPSPVWVTSLYLLRNGKWENALYQQTQDVRK